MAIFGERDSFWNGMFYGLFFVFVKLVPSNGCFYSFHDSLTNPAISLFYKLMLKGVKKKKMHFTTLTKSGTNYKIPFWKSYEVNQISAMGIFLCHR
jgi:hypothetical protein